MASNVWCWRADFETLFHSGVGEPFLEQEIRYHCPVFCIFVFNKIVTKAFSRHIWLYDQANYNGLRDEISNTDWDAVKHHNIDTYAKNVTDSILNTAKQFIPNKNIIV